MHIYTEQFRRKKLLSIFFLGLSCGLIATSAIAMIPSQPTQIALSIGLGLATIAGSIGINPKRK